MANKLVDVAQQLLGFGFGIGNHALAFAFGGRRRGLPAGYQAVGEVGQHGAVLFELVAKPGAGFGAGFGGLEQANGRAGEGAAREA